MRTPNLTNADRAELPLRIPPRLAKRQLCPTLIALLFCFFILHSSFFLRALGQNYSVDWYKIAGGGGTSTNGSFSVSGTIGQPDASANSALTGGNFSLNGGFWSLNAVQTAGYPTLSIRLVAPNSAVVSWLNTGSYTLQTNSNLAAANWHGYGGNISQSGGTNSVMITPALGNLFFRLK